MNALRMALEPAEHDLCCGSAPRFGVAARLLSRSCGGPGQAQHRLGQSTPAARVPHTFAFWVPGSRTRKRYRGNGAGFEPNVAAFDTPTPRARMRHLDVTAMRCHRLCQRHRERQRSSSIPDVVRAPPGEHVGVSRVQGAYITF
eukprot:354988-Chlamydomonas_euryale.AAC.3